MPGGEAAALLTLGWDANQRPAIPEGGYVATARAQRVTAWFQGQEGLHAFDVLGLSPQVVWLDALHAHARRDAVDGAGTLWLDAQGLRAGPFQVEVFSEAAPLWSAARDHTRARAALLSGSLAEPRELARFLAELEERGFITVPERAAANVEYVSDPAMIVELLALFAREQVEGFVQTASGRTALRIARVDEEENALSIAGELPSFVLPTHAEFPYLHAVYQVPIAALDADGSAAMPDWLLKSVRRSARRAPATAGLSIAFQHPHQPAIHVSGALLDVSRAGLSFDADPVEALLYPGLTLSNFILSSATGETVECRGVVRSVRRGARGERAVIGVSVEPRTPGGGELFARLVEDALYPSTHTHAADVWALHESSGYLNLSGKQPSDFDRLKLYFMHAARKLEAAPDIATVAYWPSQGRIEATVSHFRVYQSSWLACQLSKLKTHDALPDSRRGIRDMYMRIYESAQGEADTRWLLTYVQDAAPRWSRDIQITVAQRHVATGEGCLVPFRALETTVSPPELGRLRTDVRVVVADPVSARAAMRDLYRVRPAQYLDALDLTEGRCDLAGATARWSQAGLERQRQIFIAYEGTARAALAIVEVAELGVHIYGLLDCLRMYPLRPGGERAFGALLREAHAWFGQRGRQKFVYLEEFFGTLPTAELGFRDLGRATLSMLSVDRVPELLQRAADLASRPPPPPGRTHVREARS